MKMLTRRSPYAVTALAAAIALGASCDTQKPDNPPPLKRFALRGQVVLLIPEMQRVVVQHDAIVGWSGAGNMQYPIAEPAELAKLSVGDQIRGVVFVQDLRYWLGEIEVVGRGSEADKSIPSPANRAN